MFGKESRIVSVGGFRVPKHQHPCQKDRKNWPGEPWFHYLPSIWFRKLGPNLGKTNMLHGQGNLPETWA